MPRRLRRSLYVLTMAALVAGSGACTGGGEQAGTPQLDPRGTVLTTVKPARQDLANKVSLAGKVTMNPVFGLVAPVAGEMRYLDLQPPKSTPVKATRVGSVWAAGKAHHVEVPAGSAFAGRLVDDRSKVTAGMPIISAKYAGYGIVAEIDAAQAYKVSDTLGSVQVQIRNGPGPFPCTVLGTIAALPAGAVPEPPAEADGGQPNSAPSDPPVRRVPAGPDNPGGTDDKSEPTGMRLVCTAPGDVKLINGASATVEIITERSSNVLVLPVEAVAGSQGKGKVDVVGPDRSRQTRDVVLGLTDGKVVEIKSGLTGDETVAVPGPNLPAAKEGPGRGEPGPGGPTEGK